MKKNTKIIIIVVIALVAAAVCLYLFRGRKSKPAAASQSDDAPAFERDETVPASNGFDNLLEESQDNVNTKPQASRSNISEIIVNQKTVTR